MKRIPLLLCVLIAVAFSTRLAAQTAKQSLAEQINIPFEKFTLDNGLTVIVHEDRKAPIVAINVWYHVGAKNELPGKSGFAHLFEHLMFNGSENFNKDYFKALGAIGATDLNGTTNTDRTNYFQNVPTSALDQVLFLESDRMGHLLGAVDQAKLDEQRGVVQNEKRQGENQPYGLVFYEAAKTFYPDNHPYGFPRGTVIGSMDDLNAASMKDVQEWFKTYYGPNNATIVLAGDIDLKTAKEKITKYFGHIPAGPPVARMNAWVPTLSGNQRKVMEDRVPQARLYKFWPAPQWGAQQSDAMSMLDVILASGKTSRLYKRLVYQDQIATDVNANYNDQEIAGRFIIVATVKPGKSLAQVETAVNEEVAKLLAEGPTSEEVERARTQIFAQAIRGIERIGGFGGKSDILAENQVYGGDAGLYKESLKTIENMTAAEIKKAANMWLGQNNLTIEVHPFKKFSNNVPDVDRKTLPALGTAPAVNFPALQRATLKNGLKVVLAERKGVPLLNLSLRLDAGYSSDNAATAGAASLAMNMMDEGTATRNALQISEQLSNLGGTLNTGSGLDFSFVNCTALKANLDATLDIMGDVVMNPTFPQADFDRLKAQQLATIDQEKNQPQGIALRLMPKFMYGEGHAYSTPLTGNGFSTSVAKLTRDDMAKWHQTWVKPGSATITVVGDITLAELTAKLEKLFEKWGKGEAPKKNVSPVKLAEKPAVYIIDRPGSIQSIILAGHAVPPTNNPDEIAIESFNKILGGDFNSRINMNLREDKHWSYGVRTLLVDAKGQRPYVFLAPVQTDKTKESVAELQKEMTQLVSNKPANTDEFDRTQNDRVLALPGRWETFNAVQGALGYIVQYGLPDNYYQTYADKVRNLKLDATNAAAQKVLKPSAMTWVVVGDRAKIEAGVRELNLGEVRIIDADGNPVK